MSEAARLGARIVTFAILMAAALPRGFAQQVGEAQRGTLDVRVRVAGTVREEEVFRLKSTIEGRVEALKVSSYTWAGRGEPIGFLAHRELAALIDSKGTTSREILEARWQRMYRPTPIQCPDECFVLRLFARPRTWVKPETVLVEAARRLRLIGRVKPGDAHWVRDGQVLEYWDLRDPASKHQGRVENFVLDVQGERVDPPATFRASLTPKHYLEPGSRWEGVILAEVKKNVLRVPTAALIRHGDEVFLPVRVSTGISTYDETEVRAGLDEKRRFLMLKPGDLGSAKPFEPPPRPDKVHVGKEEPEGAGRPAGREAPRHREASPQPSDLPEDEEEERPRRRWGGDDDYPSDYD